MSGFSTISARNDCAREPIHELGCIQSFGALLAVTADWKAKYCSANSEAALGIAPHRLLASDLRELITPSGFDALEQASQRLEQPDAVERLFGIRLIEGMPHFDIALHSTGGFIMIEAEPHAQDAFRSHAEQLRPMVERLESIKSSDELFRQSVIMLQGLIGFDRVMAYRFRDDGTGEVVAEAHPPEMPPFKGLRFPKGDIPSQARSLYLRNHLRIIADVSAEPIALISARPEKSHPLDLSMSVLRAVSPTHIQYLKNMGVEASLSISIIHRGKLIGLFACHHSEPRELPFSVRTMAELYTQLFSLNLDRTLVDAAEAQRITAQKLQDNLHAALMQGGALASNLELLDDALSAVMPYDGISIYAGGTYSALGRAPAHDEFAALLPHIQTATHSGSAAEGQILAISSLAKWCANKPALTADFASRLAGALIIPIALKPGEYLLLWRKEVTKVITWAGNPAKNTANIHAQMPRKSFEAWRETLSEHCEAWSANDIAFAEETRRALLEVDQCSNEETQDPIEGFTQQKMLISELNHRVRNILNLLRSLLEPSRNNAIDSASFSELIGGRIGALASAHDNITQKNWAPAPIMPMIDSEVQPFLNGNSERFCLSGFEALLAPTAYTVLALVMHEMISNSAKYGSLSVPGGFLDIALTHLDCGDLQIAWRECGGPEIQKPSRCGFGLTIIEHSIPLELKGKTEMRFGPGGLEADFTIPSRFVTRANQNTASQVSPLAQVNPAAIPETQTNENTSMPRHALVVEDSIIIALDVSQTLQALGIETVDTHGDVEGALGAIKARRPDFAIIDINLGSETSARVTAELERLKIPFVLATGYGESSVQSAGTGAFSVLRKPYGRAEIARVLNVLHGPAHTTPTPYDPAASRLIL